MYENYRTYVISRIIAHSSPVNGGCVEYAYGKDIKHKYGLVSITLEGFRKSVPAHRALWMARTGVFDLPREVQVRHKCDNPRCVNFDHLEIGSAVDNMRRGRRARKYRKHTRVKTVRKETVLAIREFRGSLRDGAAIFGVSPSYVSRIRNGKAKVLV